MSQDQDIEVAQLEHIHQYVISSAVVSDQDEVKQWHCSSLADRLDQGCIADFLATSSQEDESKKSQFLQSEEFCNFTEMIVISQVRRDYTQQDPELLRTLKPIILKAIYKAARNIIINSQKSDSKDYFQLLHESFLKMFKVDSGIGYVTSTGQVKSSTFIYIENSLYEIFNCQSCDLNFKKIQTKISVYFHSTEINVHTSNSQGLSQMVSPKSSNSVINFKELEHTVQILNPSSPTKIFITEPNIKQKSNELDDIQVDLQLSQSSSVVKRLPLCHNHVWIKQAFICNDKFQNDFLCLRKNEDELKEGVSIYYVYRPQDDQLYAVKKNKLNSSVITFNDVFSPLNLTEMKSDQRRIREAKILAKLTHPNILRLYDWWIQEDSGGYALYMQLEYCSFPGYSHSTNDLLNFAYHYMNPMGNQEKLECLKKIMSQIIDGLEYIHKRGIVHRDLKPENIFVSINTTGDLIVMLADFDQGKDVRESKLSIITGEKISETELNSIKSKNTIQSGTSGYQTPNSFKDRAYDQCDEFYALGITLLHLVLTFPGEPKNRNHYATTFSMSDIDDVLSLFDTWSNKYVKNKPKEFNFGCFIPQLKLVKSMLEGSVVSHDQIREVILSW